MTSHYTGQTIFGYEVEQVTSQAVRYEHLRDAYLLHGPKATYRLRRHGSVGSLLYAVNTKGNICGIKGNYTFRDEGGVLKSVRR